MATGHYPKPFTIFCHCYVFFLRLSVDSRVRETHRFLTGSWADMQEAHPEIVVEEKVKSDTWFCIKVLWRPQKSDLSFRQGSWVRFIILFTRGPCTTQPNLHLQLMGRKEYLKEQYSTIQTIKKEDCLQHLQQFITYRTMSEHIQQWDHYTTKCWIYTHHEVYGVGGDWVIFILESKYRFSKIHFPKFGHLWLKEKHCVKHKTGQKDLPVFSSCRLLLVVLIVETTVKVRFSKLLYDFQIIICYVTKLIPVQTCWIITLQSRVSGRFQYRSIQPS